MTLRRGAPRPCRGRIAFRAVDTAVVTGAGRGIGREIARLLAARGYAVLVTDVNEDAARETAELLGERAWPMAPRRARPGRPPRGRRGRRRARAR